MAGRPLFNTRRRRTWHSKVPSSHVHFYPNDWKRGKFERNGGREHRFIFVSHSKLVASTLHNWPATTQEAKKMINSDTQNSQPQTSSRSNRGFASMDASKQREIARKGGQAAHRSGRAHE